MYNDRRRFAYEFDYRKRTFNSFLRYSACFAAGAMIFVVVEELVPEMAEGEHSNWGTIMFMLGFTLMMILDVALR